jgi:hypothetical protein
VVTVTVSMELAIPIMHPLLGVWTEAAGVQTPSTLRVFSAAAQELSWYGSKLNPLPER